MNTPSMTFYPRACQKLEINCANLSEVQELKSFKLQRSSLTIDTDTQCQLITKNISTEPGSEMWELCSINTNVGPGSYFLSLSFSAISNALLQKSKKKIDFQNVEPNIL